MWTRYGDGWRLGEESDKETATVTPCEYGWRCRLWTDWALSGRDRAAAEAVTDTAEAGRTLVDGWLSAAVTP